ncbi:DUF916 and DUF3324 domain-containing protein [Bombilactobacillus folatiphilus]|uniref:DUF916 and DUF3324 domain-containing protein n=1 Tax=Bombilactobacillus folatiphilus TaxID=2923362 RepID=A0ABY4P8C4_9LACO|nr:DUF3324 domain-containing protein [Bombilactobacillus folatiphilus]UQS81855.1 DUF916 and DUF3324 domain-containing protein [Bombilactobacillus folatiphilus]
MRSSVIYRWLVVIAFATFGFKQSSQGVQANGGTFSIVPEQLDNQIGSAQGGWYLHVEPNQSYQLKFKVLNFTNKENIVTVTPTISKTTPNLQLAIDDPTAKVGPKSAFNLKKMVTKNEVAVPPKGSVEASVTLKIPNQQMIGVVMGGLLFRSKTDVQAQKAKIESQKHASSTTVSTAAIAYDLILRQDDAILLPKLKLGNPTLAANGQQVQIMTPLKNTASYPFLQGKLKVKLTKTNFSRAKTNFHLDNVNIASNSQTKFALPWKKSKLVAGTYQLTYTFYRHKQHYVFHRQLHVSKQQIQKLNRLLPKAQRNYRNMILIIMLLVIVLMGLITWLVYYFGINYSRRQK